MANEIIIDTSALVEYADGTEKGKVAKEIIENENNAIFIPSIVLAEFVSKLERKGFKNTQEFIGVLAEYTISIELEAHTGISAGKKHAALRKVEKNISLVDCIVMQIAEEHGNALVLAKDDHFKHYKNTKLL